MVVQGFIEIDRTIGAIDWIAKEVGHTVVVIRPYVPSSFIKAGNEKGGLIVHGFVCLVKLQVLHMRVATEVIMNIVGIDEKRLGFEDCIALFSAVTIPHLESPDSRCGRGMRFQAVVNITHGATSVCIGATVVEIAVEWYAASRLTHGRDPYGAVLPVVCQVFPSGIQVFGIARTCYNQHLLV